jgi:hypothetical protein
VIDLCCCGEAVQFAKTITRRDAFLKRHGGGVSHSVRGPSNEWSSSVAKSYEKFYAAFFSPDKAPRIFFIHADKRWRFCSRRTTASLVTQLN